MSPEQLRSKPVDHRSDIFSVGAILYEMLAGRRAFRGETEVDTMTAVLLENPPEIDLEQARVPESILQIVRHCLEKEPENRFQSSRDLAFALETLVKPLRRTENAAQTFAEASKRRPMGAGGSASGCHAALLANQWRGQPVRPTYQRLTFEQGTVYSARFAPDFRAIVYGAAWNDKPLQIFSTVGDSLAGSTAQPDRRKLARDLSQRRTGCGAPRSSPGTPRDGRRHACPCASGGRFPQRGSGRCYHTQTGTRTANWRSSTTLKAAIKSSIRLVMFCTRGRDGSATFVSPQADKIAFMDHPAPWDDRGSIMLVDLGGM